MNQATPPCHRALADCEQRAEGAHGGVEPTEQPVVPFIVSNQAVFVGGGTMPFNASNTVAILVSRR